MPAAPRGEAAPAAPAGKLSGEGRSSQPGSPPPPSRHRPPAAANHRGRPRADWAAPPPAPPLRQLGGAGPEGRTRARPPRRRPAPSLAAGLSPDSSTRSFPAQRPLANTEKPAPPPGRILPSRLLFHPTSPGVGAALLAPDGGSRSAWSPFPPSLVGAPRRCPSNGLHRPAGHAGRAGRGSGGPTVVPARREVTRRRGDGLTPPPGLLRNSRQAGAEESGSIR